MSNNWGGLSRMTRRGPHTIGLRMSRAERSGASEQRLQYLKANDRPLRKTRPAASAEPLQEQGSGSWLALLLGAVVAFAPLTLLAQERPSAAEASASAADRSSTSPQSSDLIWLQPPPRSSAESHWYPRAIERKRGRIVELDNQTLHFDETAADSPPEIIPAQRLIWVTPGNVSPGESEALQLFYRGEYEAAVRPLIIAVGKRPPVWRQQQLSMAAAQAAWRSGRSAAAIELVSQLDRRPLSPLALAWLPVAWNSTRQPAAVAASAEARLTNPSAVVRLVAASWLLTSQRGRASQILQNLTADAERPMVALLAEAVLWRTASPPEVEAMHPQWLEKLDRLPIVLQVGPSIALIEKLQAAGIRSEAERLRLSFTLTPPHPHPDLTEMPELAGMPELTETPNSTETPKSTNTNDGSSP